MNTEKQQIQKEKIFDLDSIYELADRYELESLESGDARVTVLPNGLFTLTVLEKQDTSISIFHTTVKQLEELYSKMDEKYLYVLEASTSGSDFWDQWYAITEVLEPYKIAEESFS
jgi:hypothetical protein